jgi:hypothetical protein
VRAELLAELLCAEPVPGAGSVLRLGGARVTGRLDLESRTLTRSPVLRGCHFDNPVGLDGVTAAMIGLPGCHVPGLSAEQAHITGDLRLDQGFTSHGEVRLTEVRVGGGLVLRGARLSDPGGMALDAEGADIGRHLLADGGFTAEGEVALPDARIGGRLDFSGARLTNPGGAALEAEGLEVGRHLLCRDGFTAEGTVALVHARVGGALSFGGADLADPGGVALAADGLTAEHSMTCARLTADGEVRLHGTRIGGTIRLTGARLTNPGGIALNANGLTAGRGVDCRGGFSADGEVRLPGAHIGVQFDLSGARLTNPGGTALYADQLTVERDMFCRNRFTAEGEISLYGARIGGTLDFGAAVLGGSGETSLYLKAANVTALRLRPAQPPRGAVDLTNARIGSFDDDRETWPTVLRLRGCAYETLENDRIGVRDRLRWLKRDPDGYLPQTYDQLAAAYRRAGRTEAARTVGVAKQRHRRSVLSPLNWLLYLTVGYGYRTWLAGFWLVALVIVGTPVFGRAESHHLMRAGPNPPEFHPVAYTLDTLVPIIDLGQQKAWTVGGWALYCSWVLTVAGWGLTTAAVAGLTGIFQRD